MKEFELPAKSIYSLLKEKGVEYLFHANTVCTSKTFIEQNALLSRHFVESNGLAQSPQKSDPEDKKFDVWDHVFLDALDLHKRYSRANHYGPVQFRMKLEMLNSPLIESMYVTKSNPFYWKQHTSLTDRFYSSIEVLKDDYLTGKKLDSRIMFTLRSPGRSVKLNKFLDAIGVDNPKLLLGPKFENKTLGEFVNEVIGGALKENHLGHIPLLKRHPNGIAWCRCAADYNLLKLSDKKEFLRRFSRNP
jgi:hypothetical protein